MGEKATLFQLQNHKGLIFKPADKGRATVVLFREQYLKRYQADASVSPLRAWVHTSQYGSGSHQPDYALATACMAIIDFAQ